MPKPLHSSITLGEAASYPPSCPSRIIGASQSCQCSSISVGAPQFLSALLSLDYRFDNSFSAPSCLACACSTSSMGAPQSPPRPRLGAPLFHSRLFSSLPFRRCSAWIGCCDGYALLNPCRRSLAWICAPQFHSAPLHSHQHSPC